MTGPEQDRLDEMIEQGLGDIVPGEGVIEEVNPWRRPIGRIAAGMALTGITLNFLYLQYLLPTLGAALQYLGFRTLRRSGPAFRLAWVLSLVRLVWHAVWLMLSASPWMPEGTLSYALGLVGMAVQIVQLLALRAGLREVCRRAEVEQQGDPLGAAVIWQLLIVVLALSPLSQSWLAVIPMLIAFGLIIRSLVRVGGSLGGAGYCFVDAPVWVGSRMMKWGYFLGCLALVALTCVAVNHPRLDAQPLPAPGEAETRQALAALGMPEEVLADLSDEHVRALEGALYVEVQEETLAFRPPWANTTATEVPPGTQWMRAAIIYIELPASRMAVLNYFDWQTGSACWNDAIALGWQQYNDTLADLTGGALLYEKNGQSYTALLPQLGAGSMTTNDWFFGEQTEQRIIGTVSYPFGAENARGYVLYILQLDDLSAVGVTRGNTMLDYYHRTGPLTMPYRSPAELTSGWQSGALRSFWGMFEAVGQDGG